MMTSLITFAVAGVVAGTVASPPSKSVSVHLIVRCTTPADCPPPAVVRQMKEEASTIWSLLDVRIDWIDPTLAAEVPNAAAGLTVMLEGSAVPRVQGRLQPGLVLAALHRPTDACGPAVARVWVKQARRHAASMRRQAASNRSVPDTLADLYLGRALGRALAHEIGHYLLGSARHAPSGLMRARFLPDELVYAATGILYGLNRRERDALQSCRSRLTTQLTSSH